MRTTQLKVLLASSALAASLATLAAAQDVEAEIVSLEGYGYDELYADGMSVEELLDADVNGPTGEDIGEVENVLFDQDGRVLSIIAEVGGFLEMGDTHVNVPWDQVQVAEGGDEVTIPVAQDTVEDYTLVTDEVVTATDASTEIEEVGGDNIGALNTGPAVWKATDLIGDTARLRDGEADDLVGYGYVDDIVVRGDGIAAVVVSPGAGLGAPGYYALPYHGLTPGLGTYDLPYERTEVEALEPFDGGLLDD